MNLPKVLIKSVIVFKGGKRPPREDGDPRPDLRVSLNKVLKTIFENKFHLKMK